MSLILNPMERIHYEQVWEIEKNNNALFPQDATFEMFCSGMSKAEGWVVCDGPVVAGFVVFTNYSPGHDIMFHATARSEYQHGRWVNRSIIRRIMRRAFIDLGCVRMSGFGVPGVTDTGCAMLRRLGFELEGFRPNGLKINGKLYNLAEFGMLKEKCRWL